MQLEQYYSEISEKILRLRESGFKVKEIILSNGFVVNIIADYKFPSKIILKRGMTGILMGIAFKVEEIPEFYLICVE